MEFFPGQIKKFNFHPSQSGLHILSDYLQSTIRASQNTGEVLDSEGTWFAVNLICTDRQVFLVVLVAL